MSRKNRLVREEALLDLRPLVIGADPTEGTFLFHFEEGSPNAAREADAAHGIQLIFDSELPIGGSELGKG